ncbi:MAG: histidinol-phosphate aminotransferase family protein [Bryobacteraceae bacterium]|nr:histidinol-phosphate aminotransferase family protein [Bryobacteraceae bacterium]
MEDVTEAAVHPSSYYDAADWREVLDLRLDINPLGPSPAVRPAIKRAIDWIIHYPERTPQILRRRLANLWNVRPEQILLGNGTTELIYFLARAWLREASVIAVPARGEYFHAHRHAERVDWRNPEQWPDKGLLIVSNPNAVCGLPLPFDRFRNSLLATNNPVLVDESFIEFTDLPSAMTLLEQRPNLFVLRSMSNFYALPGLRIGALIGRAGAIDSLLEQREPWQVNVVAEAAALVAIEDREHAERSKQVVAEERQWMWSELRSLPSISPIRGEANFFLIHLAGGAADLCEWLRQRKVLVDNRSGSPGVDGEAIRLAIRTRPENARVIALLREYICG